MRTVTMFKINAGLLVAILLVLLFGLVVGGLLLIRTDANVRTVHSDMAGIKGAVDAVDVDCDPDAIATRLAEKLKSTVPAAASVVAPDPPVGAGGPAPGVAPPAPVAAPPVLGGVDMDELAKKVADGVAAGLIAHDEAKIAAAKAEAEAKQAEIDRADLERFRREEAERKQKEAEAAQQNEVDLRKLLQGLPEAIAAAVGDKLNQELKGRNLKLEDLSGRELYHLYRDVFMRVLHNECAAKGYKPPISHAPSKDVMLRLGPGAYEVRNIPDIILVETWDDPVCKTLYVKMSPNAAPL